jgi:hypothetical protein
MLKYASINYKVHARILHASAAEFPLDPINRFIITRLWFVEFQEYFSMQSFLLSVDIFWKQFQFAHIQGASSASSDGVEGEEASQSSHVRSVEQEHSVVDIIMTVDGGGDRYANA